jgi:methionyl-tRNA formyltransferase
VTQPDRPVGRHATLEAPPIKKTALAHGPTNPNLKLLNLL